MAESLKLEQPQPYMVRKTPVPFDREQLLDFYVRGWKLKDFSYDPQMGGFNFYFEAMTIIPVTAFSPYETLLSREAPTEDNLNRILVDDGLEFISTAFHPPLKIKQRGKPAINRPASWVTYCFVKEEKRAKPDDSIIERPGEDRYIV